MRWKTDWKAGERGKRKDLLQNLRGESEAEASVWRSVLRTYSPDSEEHSWKTSFSHMWPAAALLGPHLAAAKSAPSSLQRNTSIRRSTAVTCLSSSPHSQTQSFLIQDSMNY